MCKVFQCQLCARGDRLAGDHTIGRPSPGSKGRGTHAELLAVHVPKSLHKGFVFLRYCEPRSEYVGEAGAGMCAKVLVEVEQQVVEDGELLVDRGVAVADLLV